MCSAFPRHPKTLDETLITGGYPRILDRELDPAQWLGAYVTTYIERDVRSVANVGDLTTFQRFVELCAGRTAQLLNYSSLANDCGISQPTAKSWLNILETSYIVFRLPPLNPGHPGHGLTLLEAKAAATASASLFDGVNRVRRHLQDLSPCRLEVVYGGEEAQSRSLGKLVPWAALHLEDSLSA